MTFRLNKSTPGRPVGKYKAPENICLGGRSATKLEVGYFKCPFHVYCFVEREKRERNRDRDRQADRDRERQRETETEKYIYIKETERSVDISLYNI